MTNKTASVRIADTTAYPCPPWCDGVHGPLEGQHPDDRLHESPFWTLESSLSTIWDDAPTADRGVHPGWIDLQLCQHVREVEPWLCIQFDDEHEKKLTIGEAGRLHEQLGRMLEAVAETEAATS